MIVRMVINPLSSFPFSLFIYQLARTTTARCLHFEKLATSCLVEWLSFGKLLYLLQRQLFVPLYVYMHLPIVNKPTNSSYTHKRYPARFFFAVVQSGHTAVVPPSSAFLLCCSTTVEYIASHDSTQAGLRAQCVWLNDIYYTFICSSRWLDNVRIICASSVLRRVCGGAHCVSWFPFSRVIRRWHPCQTGLQQQHKKWKIKEKPNSANNNRSIVQIGWWIWCRIFRDWSYIIQERHKSSTSWRLWLGKPWNCTRIWTRRSVVSPGVEYNVDDDGGVCDHHLHIEIARCSISNHCCNTQTLYIYI